MQREVSIGKMIDAAKQGSMILFMCPECQQTALASADTLLICGSCVCGDDVHMVPVPTIFGPE